MALANLPTVRLWDQRASAFRRAADLGLVDSQFNLGVLYEQGRGVAQNTAEAYKWYLIAAKSGDEQARRKSQQHIYRQPVAQGQSVERLHQDAGHHEPR